MSLSTNKLPLKCFKTKEPSNFLNWFILKITPRKYAEHNSFNGKMETSQSCFRLFILFYPGRVNLISLHKGENSLGKIWYNAPLGEITEVQMLKS